MLLAATVVLTSCEKVIEPDLKNIEPQLVIEGEISNQPQNSLISISRSTSFSEPGTFNGVTNAVVNLSDDLGNSETLVMHSPGLYRPATVTGVPGRTYFLNVYCDGKEYTSTCKMPGAVIIDTLLQKTQIANDNTRRFLIPVYNDLLSETNFYRIKVYANNNPMNKIFARTDRLTNGTTVTQPVGPFFLDLLPGDTAKVVLYGIDKSVYDYFNGLEQALDGNSAAPANPVSNISGGCLGYFSAHSQSERKLLVKD